MVIEHGCTDPAAVSAAVLADIHLDKTIEEEIRVKLGVNTYKVWKEVKLFLDHKTCQVCIKLLKYNSFPQYTHSEIISLMNKST